LDFLGKKTSPLEAILEMMNSARMSGTWNFLLSPFQRRFAIRSNWHWSRKSLHRKKYLAHYYVDGVKSPKPLVVQESRCGGLLIFTKLIAECSDLLEQFGCVTKYAAGIAPCEWKEIRCRFTSENLTSSGVKSQTFQKFHLKRLLDPWQCKNYFYDQINFQKFL